MNNKPLILVTGKNGQLGNELQLLAEKHSEFEYSFTDIPELDITDKEKLTEFFTAYNPAICINAAAYTAVDKAETERELAMKVNAEAVKHLASHCQKWTTKFIHVSTDYVFDGTATQPYTEEHPVNPVNYYGVTKLKGEEYASSENPSSIIIRTSWVYSRFGNNFVKTMLRLMKERDSINVVNDQYGSPTYAADLAEAIFTIAATGNTHHGIYNYSNEGSISWYDFAVAIRDIAGLTCEVNPVDTAGYPTPAKRPGYSVFSKEKIQSSFGIKPRDWKQSLEQCIGLLLSS